MEFPLWAFVLCIVGLTNVLLIAMWLTFSDAVELPLFAEVRGKSFRNEVVHLDGKQFIGCTFFNVSFEYDGGRYEIGPDCTVENGGRIKLQTRKPSVRRTIELLDRLSGPVSQQPQSRSL